MKFALLCVLLRLGDSIVVQKSDTEAAIEADEARLSDSFFLEISSSQEAELLKLQQLVVPANAHKAPGPVTDLAPALAMLRGIQEDGKARIATLNSKEVESKKQFEEKEKAHEQKLAAITTKFQEKTKISKEFYDTEMKDENRIWTG
ncbi:unnamed protein product [Effrenium voratum]|nr:unnamed protein product [Effrenium voratum]